MVLTSQQTTDEALWTADETAQKTEVSRFVAPLIFVVQTWAFHAPLLRLEARRLQPRHWRQPWSALLPSIARSLKVSGLNSSACKSGKFLLDRHGTLPHSFCLTPFCLTPFCLTLLTIPSADRRKSHSCPSPWLCAGTWRAATVN